MSEILLKAESFIFSYRVAGLLFHQDKVLLQRHIEDTAFAIPGGHIAFGETSANTLIREFKEEIGADIFIERLVLIGENYFSWGEKRCQQICLYYLVSLGDQAQMPLEGSFPGIDVILNERIDLEFTWMPLSQLERIQLYPLNLKEYLLVLPNQIKHFVYQEWNA